jgi:hypothetical protein
VAPSDRLLYVWGLCWSARHGTDGVIPTSALPYLALFAGADTDASSRLVAAGLWHAVADGWTVHDFDDYQPSAAEVAETRRRRAESGRVGGQRSAVVRSKVEANGQANTQASASGFASPVASTLSKQTSTPSTSRPRPLSTSSSSSSSRERKQPAGSDDDDVVLRTIEELGRRDHERAVRDGVTVRNKAAHLASCVARRAEQRVAIAAVVAANSEWPPELIADEVDEPGAQARRAGKDRALRAIEGRS